MIGKTRQMKERDYRINYAIQPDKLQHAVIYYTEFGLPGAELDFLKLAWSLHSLAHLNKAIFPPKKGSA